MSLSSHEYDASTLIGGMETSHILSTVAGFAVLHAAVYRFAPTRFFKPSAQVVPSTATIDKTAAARAEEKESIQIRSYLLSSVHAATIFVAAMVWWSVYEWDFHNPLRTWLGGVKGTGDEWHSVGLCYTLAYFMVDSIIMAMNKHVASVGGFVHHIAIGSAFCFSLATGIGRPYCFIFCGIEELSTPFLNLKSLFRHKPALSNLLGLLFALSFFVVRLFVALWFIVISVFPHYYWMMTNSNVSTSLKAVTTYMIAMFLTSRCLNVYWSVFIGKKVLAALTGGSSKSGKKRE